MISITHSHYWYPWLLLLISYIILMASYLVPTRLLLLPMSPIVTHYVIRWVDLPISEETICPPLMIIFGLIPKNIGFQSTRSANRPSDTLPMMWDSPTRRRNRKWPKYEWYCRSSGNSSSRNRETGSCDNVEIEKQGLTFFNCHGNNSHNSIYFFILSKRVS